jgi:hypothetical protein
LLVLVTACCAFCYVFDSVDVSSKARGMGGAFVATADDATALFYNPACLAEAGSANIYATYFSPNSQDFDALAFLAFGFPVRKTQGIAVSYRKFGVEYKGEDLLSESTLSFGHGIQLLKDIHSSLTVGYAFNIYTLNLGRTETLDLGRETTYGLDIGFLGVLRERTRLGLFIKNVNEPKLGKDMREPLPQWISAGLAYNPYYGVITELDIRAMRGHDVEFHVGMQFLVTDFLGLRFGFETEPNSLTGGFTVKLKPFGVDYAYSSHSVLPGTHHISVRAVL